MAVRAVHGVIPEWDDEADEKNWAATRADIRDGCIDMIRGIAVAAEFKDRMKAARKRAINILDKAPNAPKGGGA